MDGTNGEQICKKFQNPALFAPNMELQRTRVNVAKIGAISERISRGKHHVDFMECR